MRSLFSPSARALRCASVLLMASALSAAPAMAQTPVPPDPAALSAARALMKASNIQGQMRALGPSMAKAAEQQMRAMFTEAQMPDGLQAEVAAATQSYLSGIDSVFTPELIDRMAVLYARHFSASDLQHLATVMADPVMVRFRQNTPALMGELMPVMMDAMQPSQKAFQVKLITIIRTWIKNHPEDQAKLRSPAKS